MKNSLNATLTMRKLALVLAVFLVGASTARADSLETSRPAGTDSVDWSHLGADNTGVPASFSFTTTDGVAGTGSYLNPKSSFKYFGGVGAVTEEGAGSFGSDFAPGDFLNWTDNSGPLTLTFPDETYTQIGAQIDTLSLGYFTAEICDAHGCFSETGDAGELNNGSAIYIGIDSSTPVNWVTFSLTSASGGNPQDFAIDDVTLDGGKAVTPEPGSLLLLGTGLVGLAGALRRKLAR
ncbi:MAG: PEP-CTERM sorting domain-containing protein [Terracidiphilus sp.]|jgi:hypothetical protein